MTFELRFDNVMAKPGEIGTAMTNSPLVITPAIPGSFTWLSQRSGVFTPSEPLAMDTRYEFTLRPRLEQPNGQPANVNLYRSLKTPSFALTAYLPQRANTNAISEPEIKLIFNADLRAGDAGGFLEFRDASGRSMPADVRQGTREEAPNRWQFEDSPSMGTWLQEFTDHLHSGRSRRSGESPTRYEPTNEVPNLLIVTPRRPLFIGTGWKLVLGSGLPAADRRLRLPERAEIALGNVTLFTVGTPTAQNLIGAEPCIQLSFSKRVADLLTNDWAKWIEVHPAPAGLTAEVNGHGIILRGLFKSLTEYGLIVRAGLPADEDFKLAETATFSVTMPPVPPRLYFPAFAQDQLAGGNRSFPLLSVNVAQLRVRAKLLEPQTAVHALRGYAGYFRSWRENRSGEEPYRSVNYELVPGRTVFDERFYLTNETDVTTNLDLNWSRILGKRITGIVFLDARRTVEAYSEDPPLGTQSLIQLTDLGLVWKKSPTGVEVFVFSHGTGQPVPGATARLLGGENESLREAVTDASGLAHLAADTNAEWLAVQSLDDLHVLELKEHRVSSYAFHLPWTCFETEHDPRRVMLFSDRNLYRPGEVLRLKALVRDWADAGLSVPLGLTGTVACLDSRGRQFFQTNMAFSPSGAWSIEVPLPTGDRGDYRASLRLGTQEFTHRFLVQDFQPSAFEIALDAKTVYGAGEKMEIPLSARYFFGKTLSRAQVKWSVEAEDADFKPEGFEGFTFKRNDVNYHYGHGHTSLAVTGQGVLSGSTNLIIAPEVPVNPLAPQPRSVSLLVEVTDLNQQTLSRRAEFVRHSSDFYLGLRQGTEVLIADNEMVLEAIAVSADGKPWPESVNARLTLQRINWENVRVQGAGRSVRYRNDMFLTNVLTRDTELQPVPLPAKAGDEIRGQALAGLPPLSAGEYVLELETKDAGGRKVIGSLNFTVAAKANLGWDYRNDVQLTLKPGQRSYAPGQTAEILVEAPFSGAALVTVEREKVMRSFSTRLEGNAPSIHVPIEPGDAPNVFVSVTLVRGADDCPRNIKEPEYRMGYCQLPVEDPRSKLAVTVTPAATNYLPAQSVEVTVEIKDSRGAAVSGAEVTLYAVDDGILTITDYGLPDAHAFFYAARALAVSSSVSLPNLMSEDPEQLHFQNKGYLGGGGGSERLRKNFLACAFWNAALISGPDGKITARFPAPDSLTRYRIFAVAHSGASQFGSGQSVFQVAKPLVIDPALPRFANLTDQILARAVVQNQTAHAGEALVSLELDDKAKVVGKASRLPMGRPAPGPIIAPESPGNTGETPGKAGGTPAPLRLVTRRLSVPANGSAVVEFPLEFTEPGVAKWIWKARFVDPAAGDFTDTVQSTLDVGHVAPILREILLARVTAPETNLVAFANPQILAGRGTITVNVANSHLNELGEAISQLLHYPYGCVEQTGSSLLPWIVSRDAPALFPLLHRGTNEVESAIRTGIARLYSMQTQSGGLGYWPGAREPMVWASAYGALVLALAQRHGVEVAEQELGQLTKYLSEQLRSMGADGAELSDFPLALYALALANHAEPAYCEKLYALREKLSPENRALLALALVESGGPAQMIRDLLTSKSSARRNNYGDFGCPARDQAIRLLAWVRCAAATRPLSHRIGEGSGVRADDLIIDTLEADLMREQHQAHWGTTQGDAWAILALTEYARSVEETPRISEGRLVWQGESVPFRLDKETNCFSRAFPLTNSAAAPLALVNSSGTRLFTSVTLEARSPVAQQPRQDRGFSLQRRYERLDDDNQPWPLAESGSYAPRSTLHAPRPLTVGDRVLVTLDLTVREPARYVAVDDALPSILEAVNPEFKTQTARGAPTSANRYPEEGGYWMADFHELRKDRFLSFANQVSPGTYTLRYVARVRAAGDVTAPSAKVEEMYHPDRYGLSETRAIFSERLE